MKRSDSFWNVKQPILTGGAPSDLWRHLRADEGPAGAWLVAQVA